jgi:hypothetical protein
MTSIRDSIVTHQPPSKDFTGWFSEAVWGHRLQAQSSWATMLELLGMAEGMLDEGKLLSPTTPAEDAIYAARISQELRILLFNNPRMLQIRNDHQGDENLMWESWLEDMKGRSGDDAVQFHYLRDGKNTFASVVEKIELLRKLTLNSSKTGKFTNKLLFPIGPAALYEPSDLNFARDRTIFTRTGEIAYLMLTRASEPLRNKLRNLLTEFLKDTTSRNKLLLSLTPAEKTMRGKKKGGTFLPYTTHPAFDRLAGDMIAIFELGLPHQDALEHIRFLLPFHIYLYGLETSWAWAGRDAPPFLVCEIPGPKMDVVRRASIGNRDENEALGVEAMRHYVDYRIKSDGTATEIMSPSYRPDVGEKDRSHDLVNEFQRIFHLDKDRTELLQKLETREEVQAKLQAEAGAAYRSGTLAALESLGREAGLIDSRGTNRKRYAPTDNLLRALIFANIPDESSIEEKDFLKALHARYGLVFAPSEAAETIKVHNSQHYDEADYKRNQFRLTRRLVGLGLGHAMSDSCAYISNPLGRPATI